MRVENGRIGEGLLTGYKKGRKGEKSGSDDNSFGLKAGARLFMDIEVRREGEKENERKKDRHAKEGEVVGDDWLD